MNILKNFLKITLSAVTALICLSALFSPYSSMPVHRAKTLGNTDYVWPPDSRWSKMTEGIAWGRFDGQGFNNLKTVDHPDILILGSSHMEATNVMQKDSMACILQKGLGGKASVYNMGMSGHNLAKVLQYLPKTLELYSPPPKYIAIETDSLAMTPERADQIFEHKIEFTASHENGLTASLQRLPFLRILYYQWNGGLKDMLFQKKPKAQAKASGGSARDQGQYGRLLSYVSNLKDRYGTRITILYHPTEKLQKNGSLSFSFDQGLIPFKKACRAYGVDFLDMTEAFKELYASRRSLPHGFITGETGKGHLNSDGHRVMAKELYDFLIKRGDI